VSAGSSVNSTSELLHVPSLHILSLVGESVADRLDTATYSADTSADNTTDTTRGGGRGRGRCRGVRTRRWCGGGGRRVVITVAVAGVVVDVSVAIIELERTAETVVGVDTLDTSADVLDRRA
jgi:hypothetical protein